MKNWWLKPIIVSMFLCALLYFIAYQVNRVMDYPDFLAYWLAGNFISHGISPYNEVLFTQGVLKIGWMASPAFLYPLPAGLFFVLWGMLPYRFAYTLWMFFSMILILSSTLLLLSTWEYKKVNIYIFPVMAGLVLFRPLIVSIRNGQIGGLFIFILTGALLLWVRGKWFLGGLIAALLLIKPSIAIPILGLAGLYLLIIKKFKALTGMAVGALLLMAVGWVNDPLWVGKYLRIGQQKFDETFGLSPSIWGAANQFCGKNQACFFSVGTILSILLLGIFLYSIFRFRPGVMSMSGMAVSLGLLLSPYSWAYEQVLLVIPIVWIVGQLSESGPFLVGALVFLTISLLSLVFLLIAIGLGHDAWSFMVPLACFIACLALINRKRKIPV